jgi:pyruvate kinase
VADGIMVARGDLGLQTEIEEVPAIQKRLIHLCNKRGKPVITATEMLKSMTASIEPTRAEGTDVFNAILDGSDAVMMSEETSRGMYPFHSIRKMVSIAVQAERYFEGHDLPAEQRRAASLLRYQEFLDDDYGRVEENNARFDLIENFLDRVAVKAEPTERRLQRTLAWAKELYKEKWGKSVRQTTTNRITQATCTMSEAEDVKAIIAASTTGRTVRMISRLRPGAVVIGATHDLLNTRKLALSYGVVPVCIGEAAPSEGTEGIFARCQREIVRDPFLGDLFGEGDNNIIFTAGTRMGKPGTTDLIHMRRIRVVS